MTNTRVLLCVDPADDGYPYALRALTRFASPGDEVHVLHVAQPEIEWVSDSRGRAALDSGPLARSLEQAMRERGHEDARVTVTREPRRHVGDAIVEHAKEVDADVVVVATHGRSGFSRLVLGSVAERVVRAAHCDVYVARVPRT